MAIELHRRNRFKEAEALYRSILDDEPGHFGANHLLGVLFLDRGEPEAAERQIGAAIEISPQMPGAHNNRGIAFKQLGRLEEALDSYNRAIALKPEYPEALNNRGIVLKMLQRYQDALEDFDKAIALKPHYAEAHNNRGNVLADLGRLDDAVASYEKAIAAREGYADALNNCASTLLALDRPEAALENCDRSIALRPNFSEAFNNRGNILMRLGRAYEALASYDKAIALRPDYSQAFNNRGNALLRLGRTQEAFESFDRAVIQGERAAFTNRGIALVRLKRIEDAVSNYDNALANNPDFAEAAVNRAYAKLALGRMASDTWMDYEQRWFKKSFLKQNQRHTYNCPEWTGQNIQGHSILVYHEQGLGDMVQFCRYLLLLEERGAEVTFLVPDKMVRLLKTLSPRIRVIASPQPLDKFDFQCAMMSLPYRFGTTLDTIPASVPYLRTEPERVAFWREKLGTDGIKVGVCWHSKPIIADRSFPLRELYALSQLPGIRLISLQKQYGLDQLDTLPAGMVVEAFTDELDAGPEALLDTAAAMESLDLVLTSDTSIAHVAGALARPVWLALCASPDWRWFLNRNDSPWYPTMRLFRQESFGEWAPVFREIVDVLAAGLGSKQPDFSAKSL